jgi:hypothetical protein
MDRRLGVGGGTDVVLTVAVPAAGDFPDSSFEIGASMNAVGIIEGVEARLRFLIFPVADAGAVRVRDVLLVGDVFLLLAGLDGVAGDAVETLVDGAEELNFVDPEFCLARGGRSVTGKAPGIQRGCRYLPV